MDKREICIPQAPTPTGPYSQGIAVGDFLFIAGTTGLDLETGAMIEGLENQTHQIMKSLAAVLEANGMTFKNVVKVNVFLTDMNNFDRMNAVYASYLEKPYPVRTCVEVSRLPRDCMVEIECIAHR